MAIFEYFGWGLLIPAALSVIYGATAHYAMDTLGYSQKNSMESFGFPLSMVLLFTLWVMTDMPLPLLYILAFLLQLFLLIYRGGCHTKELFLVNLTHLMSMALHIILISGISLITSTQVNAVLHNPLWRIVTVSIVLTADSFMACLFPRWNLLLRVLRTQLDSEEVGPFMAFLWFCHASLLLDSVLCASEIEWDILPLFLAGSTVLMEFYLLRFLRHLFTVLVAQYLEKEHRRLIAELEQQKETDKTLLRKSEKDSLTGIFSRQYAMERIEYLLKKNIVFSLIYIDLDHLKQINDQMGHRAGDMYLIRFAESLGRLLRETDTFARIGGDEFIIILPDCTEEIAVKRMERIRTRLCEENSPPLPFSFGATFVSRNFDKTVEQVLYLADQAMYRDKRTRR